MRPWVLALAVGAVTVTALSSWGALRDQPTTTVVSGQAITPGHSGATVVTGSEPDAGHKVQRITIVDSGISSGYLKSCTQCRLAMGEATDETGHGTSMAVIVAGTNQFTGIAPGAEVLIYKVSTEETGEISRTLLLRALDRIANDDVDVINLSIGSQTPDNGLRRRLMRLIASGSTVIAAGNDDDVVLYPGSFCGVVSAVPYGQRPRSKPCSDAHGDVRVPPLRIPVFQLEEGPKHDLEVLDDTSSAAAVTSGLAAQYRSRGCRPRSQHKMIPALQNSAAKLLDSRAISCR